MFALGRTSRPGKQGCRTGAEPTTKTVSTTRKHMKTTNLIDTMSVKDLQSIENAAKAIRSKAPFLVTLTLGERQTLRYPTPIGLAFMDTTLKAALERPDILPARVKLEDFEAEVRLVQSLDRCISEIEHLASDLRDTMRVLSSDPMKKSIEIRDGVRSACKSTPALEEVARRLAGPRRVRTSRASKPATAPTAAPAVS